MERTPQHEPGPTREESALGNPSLEFRPCAECPYLEGVEMAKAKLAKNAIRKFGRVRVVKLSYGKTERRVSGVLKARDGEAPKVRVVETERVIKEADEYWEKSRLRPVG